jgi:hypothetical protein
MRQGRLQLQRRLLLPLPLRGPSGPAGNEARVEKKNEHLSSGVGYGVCLHSSCLTDVSDFLDFVWLFFWLFLGLGLLWD